jgi:two-component system NtrC family response regulator
MPNILIVDDDKMFHEPLSFYLNEIGYDCDVASHFIQGEALANKKNYDIVLLDVFLPDMSGLEGISRMKKTPSAPEVIIITGQGNLQGAEMALKNGAWDYLEKPLPYNRIKLLLGRAMDYRQQKLKLCYQRVLQRDGIIGNSPKLMECLEIVAKAANTSGSVFISGETGTGKEQMAQTVHLNSSRRMNNFITLDCTNIPVNLVETLLFGYTKGTFTGADTNREGLIRQADRGTLFLDEVGDLPLPAQKSILGVLQRKKYRPLGAKEEIACDFRVVSATNRDLKKMVDQGQFRKDLYYRLVSFSVHLPPLRERFDDLKLLTNYYIHQICEEMGIDSKGVSKNFMEYLMQHNWPGNIRELIHTLQTAIAHATHEPVLYSQHLPFDIRIGFFKTTHQEKLTEKSSPPSIALDFDLSNFPKLKFFRETIESKYLDELIRYTNGKAEEACKIAGVSRSGWYHLMEKHGRNTGKRKQE